MNIWEYKKNYYILSLLFGGIIWILLYLYFVIGILTNPLSKEVNSLKKTIQEKQEEIKKLQKLKMVKENELKQIEELQKKTFNIAEAKAFYEDIIKTFNNSNIILSLKLERISSHEKYLNLGNVEISFNKKIDYLPEEEIKRLAILFVKLFMSPMLDFPIQIDENIIKFVAVKEIEDG